MSELLDFIQRVGFPIAMVVWFLVRLEPRLQRMEERIAAGQERVRASLQSLRRAQLLYVIGHPAFSPAVKEQAKRMMLETAETDDGSIDPRGDNG